jgi:hypothetical protein
MGQRLVSSSTDNNISELNGRNQSSSSNSYEHLGSILCGVMCGSRIQLWKGQTYTNKRPSQYGGGLLEWLSKDEIGMTEPESTRREYSITSDMGPFLQESLLSILKPAGGRMGS